MQIGIEPSAEVQITSHNDDVCVCGVIECINLIFLSSFPLPEKRWEAFLAYVQQIEMTDAHKVCNSHVIYSCLQVNNNNGRLSFSVLPVGEHR